MYLCLVDDSRGHRKAKGVYKNVAATISHNRHKDLLLNKKCQILNRNQSKNQNRNLWTTHQQETSFSWFNDKVYIQNNGYDGIALGYQS